MRWQNVETAFELKQAKVVEGKRILLVDDVITTGATLEACGQTLVKAGVASLSVAGIAYAAG
jgi:predicted amidophosphoribosyltransferase